MRLGTEPITGLAQGVHARALQTPGALALVDGDQRLDYAALDAAGAAVADGLRRSGVQAGQAVAVHLPRSWQLVCAMLGILRVGARVVPLDAQSPPERRHHILTDSAAVALIHADTAPENLPDGVRALPVTALLAHRAASEAPFTGAPVSFLFYTSGTTGLPKGVEVTERGVLRLARPGYLELEQGARYACMSNPAFDALNFEVWAPLLTGGCCVIMDDSDVQTPDRLAAALLRERIDTLFVTVALFNAVVDAVPDCFAGVGQVLVGGEQLNSRLIHRWYRHNADSPTRLHNVYGPTETTTFALCHPIPRDFAADVVPIGRPLPDTLAVLVVPGTDREAAPGEVAELHLAGAGLAAGYRNLPEETERRFVRLPWYDDGRDLYYRTGDLVRADGDGVVEYVGRADRQVKVRGFRIEPGELERQIVKHPAVRQAYVCTRRDGEYGPNELLAYLVPDGELTFGEFDRHLANGLPAYMRPHHLYLLDALPLNANGKVDQAALLARDTPAWRRTNGTGPAATAWEREVLELVAEVLGMPDPRLDDSWTAIGGDSLKALRLRFEVRRRWGCDLPQSAVLRGDFTSLAEAVATARAAGKAHYPVPAGPTEARTAPATSEQQRLWLFQQRSPRSRAYDVTTAVRIDGPVDATALRRSLRRLVDQHPALRTGFEATPEGLRQVVGEPYDPWTDPGTATPQDENGQRAFAEAFFALPFDLALPRMLRTCWLPQHGGGVLLLHLHHIAVDGWSLNVLFRDLSAGYQQHPSYPAQPALTPLDFAHWQADWSAHPGYRAQRAELRDHYAGLAEVAEPLQPSGTRPMAEGRLLHTTLDVVRRAHVDRLCAELGLTRFQLLLGVFAWSLYAVTGRTRLRVATPVANRPVQEFEASVGMFANTVLLPLSLTPGEELRDQLRDLGAGVREVLDRQDVTLSDVLADLGPGAGQSPFDILFVQENTDFGALALPSCAARPLWWAPAEAKCPMTLFVAEHAGDLDCVWEYAADHFDAAQVEAMAGLFRRGLDLLAAGEPVTVAELAAPYRDSLPQHGDGPATELTYTTVADGFARQVARTPDAAALNDGLRTLSYAELDAHAAALATELRSAYPVPDEDDRPRRVALYFEPCVEHVVALLALARLNLTIVPLDPSYPPHLLRLILQQADPLCVLLPPGGAAAFDALDAGDVDRLTRHTVTLAPVCPPAPVLPLHHGVRPLYTLFTSGSTGTPKGVQVSDRTLCNLLQWQAEAGGLGAPAVTQQFSMLSFDVSFQEIFGTLCGGGRLHLVRPGWRQDGPALLTQLESAGVERVFMPYVALQLLAEHAVHLGRYPAELREVVTAGEQLVCTDAIRRWFAGLPGARLFNHYGPTETHVVSSLCLDGDPAHWPDRPAIGRPVGGAVLRVVDEAGQPVPAGCPGDLLIGGTMAERCYLGEGEDGPNDERFVELPGLGLFYRSGDRARFDREGLLHYLGRDDQQIKLSGHRLELGSIEVALLRHPEIVNAVVARDGELLTACFQDRGRTPTAEELTAHLAALLPAYVRIDRFRRLETLPCTPSGKLDRAGALRSPGEELRGGASGGPVLSEFEARLAEAFEAVTGAAIGPDRSFFEAGASSLTLMRYHLRCTTELGLRFTVAELFEHVTVRRLARFLDGPESTTSTTGTTDTTGARAEAVTADEPIAIIGMAVRLPGAPDLASFWELVTTAGRGIEHFDAADGLVGARSQLDGPLAFDPDHFGISRYDARLMDPQQRHLLMACTQALAHAGIQDPSSGPRVGLIAGAGENTYFQAMLREADPGWLPDGFRMALHHEKDFLATKAAYHLGLTGPAFTAQAACASSLVAVHLAASLLRQGDAEVMLAGGVLVDPTLTGGYRYQPQHIFSVDGHCRPFSGDASGTIGASGIGVVVLKPLRLARRDGDTVYAVITGSALNNDGSEKLSYSAPSLAGQREVIRAALRRSGRTGADLAYVEAHGTGTRLGDPVEVDALRQAFGVAESGRCALTSVKSQIGHLGAAAGVVGLIRAALSVHHGVIPPNVDFRALNPHITADPTPFYIPTTARSWPADRPRVAAVSSFGIGGTNAHVVLEAVPPTDPGAPAAAPDTCLVLSATSAAALRTDATRIADYLAAHPEAYGEVLRHLQAGRPARQWRLAAVCPDASAAVDWLRTAVPVAPMKPDATPVPTTGRPADEPADAWADGYDLDWPQGPAQAPWDFPPPAFELADYDFERTAVHPAPAVPEGPQRLAETDWLSQPHWVRLRRASTGSSSDTNSGLRESAVLVVVTDGPAPAAALRVFEAAYARVVQVSAADAFARHGDDVFEVDATDPASLRRLLDAVTAQAGQQRIDWLHALPLGVAGPVGRRSLEQARWACVDAPAALVQALAGMSGAPRPRLWWLSYRARPVEGAVERPELGLLAGISEVAPQEIPVDGRWVDLPSAALTDWAAPLAALLTGDGAGHTRQLALRQGYWWQQAISPVAEATAPMIPPGDGVHLVLGGTGGIGASVAAWLLEQTEGRVLLLARRPQLPAQLARWASRVDLIEGDLAQDAGVEEILRRVGGRTARLDSVTHAAGVGSGGLIVRRDAVAASQAAKLGGALLVERLIERYAPALAVYCSSMSALLGGVGQLDYAAANGLLDGFAHHRPGGTGTDPQATVRLGIDWDVWRETGMALRVPSTDARHQAHLATGLTIEEGKRVFARAMALQLPQLLVSTTDIEESRVFYTASAPAAAPAGTAEEALSPADHLTDRLCEWLGVDRIDPDDALYDLGADSLTMLDLIGSVKQHFGVELELSRLSHQVSVNEILARLEEAIPRDSDDVVLEIWQEGTGRDVLCLVHPVGGDIQAYRSLVSAIDRRLTVCLIADPALRRTGLPESGPPETGLPESGLPESGAPGWPLAERARRYHAALHGHFADRTRRLYLAGWSFGAWAAMGMAAEAEAAGRPAQGLYLLDPPAPGSGSLFQGYDEAQLEAVFAHELGDGGPSFTGEAKAYAERLAQCCRANLASMADHELPQLSATPGQLWLAEQPVAGLPRQGTPDEQLTLWERYFPASGSRHRLATTHYGVVRPPYVHTVTAAINAALDE
ncbi:non-ribosomal peptide synthetase [Kitasatospora sp. MAP5-34]|uniref:non-ribosomal peptide synthetase n=1 Tax=Kitasatospora sp. MAP5-34 TaxID=3035102 RepID=UPI002474006A|nr:non-ribosomal peptide synthetase [Kitasatospora sp. MAP5-34]MDH6579156.1 amino acid adenylation domain-containing protein [Kitasatospora sp. MAP5-34]